MINLLAEAAAAEPVNWRLEIANMIAPAVLVLLGLWVWHLQKRSEPRYESISYLTQKRLDGLMKAWSLLAYITDVENSKAVMLWEKDTNTTMYYIRPKQAKEYMVALAEMFYNDGYGLLLGRDVKKLLYEYRNNLYDVLLQTQGKENDERIKIENEKLVESMKRIYGELNAELRKELGKIEK
jgi:hypothetical protein